jgi:hypothetical protein
MNFPLGGRPIIIDIEALRLNAVPPKSADTIDLSALIDPLQDLDAGIASLERRMADMGEMSLISAWARRRSSPKG